MIAPEEGLIVADFAVDEIVDIPDRQAELEAVDPTKAMALGSSSIHFLNIASSPAAAKFSETITACPCVAVCRSCGIGG